MKMRIFQQNKLWRDKAVKMLEDTGSEVDWHRLSDGEFNQQLRLKIIEEAAEVALSKSNNELIEELADIMEVISELCTINNISWNDVIVAGKKKRDERGGFQERVFVTKAAHKDGSPAAEYCLKSPDKYPEITTG